MVTFDRICGMLQHIRDFINFSPVGYLNEYYGEIGPENAALLSFFAEAYASFDDNSQKMAEVGGGPTVYQLISMAPKASSIFFSDFLNKNLNQVKSWAEGEANSHNWDEFFEFALRAEHRISEVGPEAIIARKELLISKLKSFAKFDIFKNEDIDSHQGLFDVVSMNFVAESITSDINGATTVIERASKLLKPGGYIILTGLLCADYWIEKNKKFPAANISEDQVRQILTAIGFNIEIFRTVSAERRDGSVEYQGYHGIFMTRSRMNN